LEISDSNPGRLGWDLWMGEGYPQLFIPGITGPLVEPKKKSEYPG